MPPEGSPPLPGSPGQLYNLDDDPGEQNNLWDKYPEVVNHLKKILERYQQDGKSAPARN
jgi:hypothetical protein